MHVPRTLSGGLSAPWRGILNDPPEPQSTAGQAKGQQHGQEVKRCHESSHSRTRSNGARPALRAARLVQIGGRRNRHPEALPAPPRLAGVWAPRRPRGPCPWVGGAERGKGPFLGPLSRSEPRPLTGPLGARWLPGGRLQSAAPASCPGSARQSIFTFRYNFSTRPKRPVSEPKFGFVAFAETWNGRLAMMGFIIGLGTELLTGQGILSQIGLG